jgi:hypothetical protein
VCVCVCVCKNPSTPHQSTHNPIRACVCVYMSISTRNKGPSSVSLGSVQTHSRAPPSNLPSFPHARIYIYVCVCVCVYLYKK